MNPVPPRKARKKRSALALTGWLVAASVFSAKTAHAEISTVDLVTVTDGLHDEAIYFYENNWRKFRDDAKARGYISGYQLLVDPDGTILLITVYPDQARYDEREANFREVMPADGPDLLNDAQPREFSRYESLGVFESL